MTIKEALEVLQKQSDCWDKITECSANCEECECHADASNLVEAVKTVLDAFGNCSELPNSSDDCVSRQADLIDRAEAQTELQFAARRYTVAKEAHGEGQVVWSENLISVTDAMNALRKVSPIQAKQMIPTQMSGTSEDTVDWGYISVNSLLEYCENNITHSITPNEFMRMNRVKFPKPCTDAISRQAAIDLCKQRLYETAINNSGYKCDADDVYSEMAERRISNWLNDVPSVQAEQKWIPCSERVPEDDNAVLITHSKGVGKAWWNGRYWTSIAVKKYKTVSAWMPLPEPYRGDTND